MRIYFLEEPLTEKELRFVMEVLDLSEKPDQIRIPYVLPPFPDQENSLETVLRHENLFRHHLKNAGIESDCGKQVCFVAPKDMHWYSVLFGAIKAETGRYPYLIQTAVQREHIGNPGEIRVLDTEGLMGEKE